MFVAPPSEAHTGGASTLSQSRGESNLGSAVCTGQGDLENGCILQDHDQLNIIMINGHVHKAGVKEYVIPMQDATGVDSMTNEMLFPDLILKRMFCQMELV